mgnify:CR=1 FL=1
MKIQIRILTGNNYLLVPMTLEHITKEYIGWLNDPNVNQFLEVRNSPQTRLSVEHYINDFSQSDDKYLWAIFPVDGTLIGTVNLHSIDSYHKTCELGLMIGNIDYWGKTTSTEAISLVINFAYTELGLNRIAGGTYSSNIGMNFTFKKLGFTREGIMRLAYFDGKKFIDAWRWGLLKSE